MNNGLRTLIPLIISKYPGEVILKLSKLEKSKDPTALWTMQTLRKAISHYIAVQKNLLKNSHSSCKKGCRKVWQPYKRLPG